MRRWVSVFLATTMLSAVVTTGIFAIAKSNVAPFGSYAAPVAYANPKILTDTDTDTGQASTATGTVPILFNPRMQYSYASWQIANPQSNEGQLAYKIVSQELSKYTAANFVTLGLKKIYLVKSLYVDGTFRSGMPEAQFEDAVYFDIDSKYFTSEDGKYMRRTIHHEIRHLADYNQYSTYKPQDSKWLQCNPAQNSYLNSVASMYANPAYAHAAHPKAGFITGYATSGIDEDRAEVYAYYMTDRAYLYKTAIEDASLSCKVAQTETLIR